MSSCRAMTLNQVFAWFAAAWIFCLSGCYRAGYELNRQSLKLAADQRGISFNLRDIVDTHEIGLWSVEHNAANDLLTKLDVGRAAISANSAEGGWTFSPFKPEEHKGFGATLSGNVSLGYINGRGSAMLTIPLKAKSTLDEDILKTIEAVIFVSPRQSGL